MGIATTELSPVEKTAFLTEYARALDSQWPKPILGDTLAHEVVGKIDYDFKGLGIQTSVLCQTALRAKMLDDRVRAFVEKHPDAVVVDLGAGLDSGLVQRRPAGDQRAARRGPACPAQRAHGARLAGR
jgi:O-methyltransferase involved in polyketide biosynthesis